MRQKQRKTAKRADAEDGHGLDVAVWVQGEKFCDCHSQADGELLKIGLYGV